MLTLRLNCDKFDAVRGSTSIPRFADQIGVTRDSAYRAYNGKPPSPRFQAHLVAACTGTLGDFFDVVEVEEEK